MTKYIHRHQDKKSCCDHIVGPPYTCIEPTESPAGLPIIYHLESPITSCWLQVHCLP